MLLVAFGGLLFWGCFLILEGGYGILGVMGFYGRGILDFIFFQGFLGFLGGKVFWDFAP